LNENFFHNLYQELYLIAINLFQDALVSMFSVFKYPSTTKTSSRCDAFYKSVTKVFIVGVNSLDLNAL